MIAYDYWQEQPWDVKRDPSLAFNDDILKQALGVWCAGACSGAIPPRSALTARAMKPFLGNVVIVERQGDGHYRVRLMGTKITQVIGEMQGMLLEEVLPPDAVARWRTAFDMVLAELRPMRFVSHVIVSDLSHLQAENLLAPLLDEAGRPAMVLCVTTFKSGAPAATLTHETPGEGC